MLPTLKVLDLWRLVLVHTLKALKHVLPVIAHMLKVVDLWRPVWVHTLRVLYMNL
jgi:hypothetical protein